VQLRVERQGNHAWISVLGAHDGSPALSQQTARAIEAKLTGSGGRLTVMPAGDRVAYALVLPLRPVVDDDRVNGQHAAAANPAPEAVDTQQPLEGLRVLVIDDQEDARDALEAVLTLSGAHVQLAASGDEALAAFARAPSNAAPHVLLCDIVLGAEDGYQVLARIREFEAGRGVAPPERVPGIALTGHHERARRAGFALHLTKPVPAPVLIESILDVTGKTRE
jgi:ATP-binding cassette subfamily B protein